MKTKALIIIFFALMLSAAALASEKQRHMQIHIDAQDGHDSEMQSFRFSSDDEYSDDMEIHELHEVRIVREEVDVTN